MVDRATSVDAARLAERSSFLSSGYLLTAEEARNELQRRQPAQADIIGDEEALAKMSKPGLLALLVAARAAVPGTAPAPGPTTWSVDDLLPLAAPPSEADSRVCC